jgi:hypothetical protein
LKTNNQTEMNRLALSPKKKRQLEEKENVSEDETHLS